MNGGVQSDLASIELKNREQLEYFHSRILRICQEIILSVETVSTKRLLFKYMKSFSNSNKPKALIAPKMVELITFLDNNGNFSIHTGGNINVLYHLFIMIEYINIPPCVDRKISVVVKKCDELYHLGRN